MSDNIEQFNSNVGIIFSLLYKHFPIRMIIDETHVVAESTGYDEGWQTRYHKQTTIYKATMAWLIEAGYIWGEKTDSFSGVYKNCVLSVKGLEILNMPSSLGSSMGSKLSEAALSASTETMKDVGKQLLSAGASLMMRYGQSVLGG